MRACTATTLSARYRDPVIRPSIDSMIFRNDFGKKTTSTDNANHPRGTALFLRPWDTTLRDSSIAGNKALRDSWFPRVPFTPRSLSLSFSVSFSVPLQLGIAVFRSISPRLRVSASFFSSLSRCAISTDRSEWYDGRRS